MSKNLLEVGASEDEMSLLVFIAQFNVKKLISELFKELGSVMWSDNVEAHRFLTLIKWNMAYLALYYVF